MTGIQSIQQLTYLLEEYDISLYELSKISNIRYSTLTSAVKRGTQLSLDTISLICAGLGIEPYEFFMSREDWDNIEAYCERRKNRAKK